MELFDVYIWSSVIALSKKNFFILFAFDMLLNTPFTLSIKVKASSQILNAFLQAFLIATLAAYLRYLPLHYLCTRLPSTFSFQFKLILLLERLFINLMTVACLLLTLKLQVEGIGPFLHRGVPVVFDVIVSPSLEILSDFRSAIAPSFVEQKKQPFFFEWPCVFLDIGMQVVKPALSALFAYSTWQVFSGNR